MSITENIFPHVGSGVVERIGNSDQIDYEGKILMAINDAIDYEESHLMYRRQMDMAYYEGHIPDVDSIGVVEDYQSGDPSAEDEVDDGRSTFVSTDVRDTIMGIMPSLIRIFASTENVVDYIANREGDDAMAKEATEYVNYIFWDENEGFLLINSILSDALMVASGIVTWYTDVSDEVTEQEYQNITQEQLQFLFSERDDIEVVDLVGGENGIIDSVTLSFTVSKPKTCVKCIPPEEFRVSSDAKTIKTARVTGWERIEPMSELVKRGLDREWLEDIGTEGESFSEERYLRNPGQLNTSIVGDGILFGEWCVRIDADGDGIDELRHITTVGPDRIIVGDYIKDHVNFALFCPDPKSHTVMGNSISKLVRDIQQIKSNMMRASLDNLANAVVPRTGINETLVNIDDALNTGQNGIIRTKGNPNETIADLATPFVGAQVFQMVEQMDAVRAARTGITEASKGLDPEKLQSTALKGIDAIVDGAQERIELIAMILAQTGFKDMYSGLLREITNNPNPEKMIKLRGEWARVNPSTFDPNMRVKVNPTLGKGGDTTRLMALQEVKATQEGIIAKYGLGNGVVGVQEVRNTIVDILSIANIKNVSRYFREISPEQAAAIENAPTEPSPEDLIAKAELEKVKKDMVIAINKDQQAQEKLDSDDAFRRDQLLVDSALEALSIFAQYPGASLGDAVDEVEEAVA